MASVNEQWRAIAGFSGKYSVSNFGGVKNNWSGRIFKTYLTHGYPMAALRHDGKRITKVVSRLMAEAFIENPENKPTVNHINGIRNDNRLANLEWATHSEQQNHAYKFLGKVGAATGKFSAANPTSKPVLAIGFGETKFFPSGKDAAEFLKMHPTAVNKVLKGKLKGCKGYKFKYYGLG